MTCEAGEVVVIRFPRTDQRSGKQRPALILTPRSHNGVSRDAIAAYVTSQPQQGRWSLPITDRHLREGHLVKPSWVRIDRIATLEKTLIRKRVGRLDATTLEQVRRQLAALLVEAPT